MPLAGPGGRSYAFIIDWHIRILLALGWMLAAFLGMRAFGSTEIVAFVVGVPASLIYLLYHPIVELAMNGQTPGKRMAGVRVVARNGQPPSVTAILIRNVFRLIDSFPAFYTVGLLSTMLTRDYVRVGDLAAGTVLVYLPKDTREGATRQLQLARQTRLPADLAELVIDLLDRWPQLNPSVRRELASALLSRAGESSAAVPGTAEDALRAALRSLIEPAR